MTSYTAPVKDMQFLLHDVLAVGGSDVPGYADMDASFTAAVLEEAGKLATDLLGAPHRPAREWLAHNAPLLHSYGAES